MFCSICAVRQVGASKVDLLAYVSHLEVLFFSVNKCYLAEKVLSHWFASEKSCSAVFFKHSSATAEVDLLHHRPSY